LEQIRPSTAEEAQVTSSGNMLDSDVKMVLARNFAKKIANSKKISEETKESVTLLRNQFLIYLAKVYDNATKKEGVLGCHRLI
jgi:K+-transporting ATPase c subunit